MDENLQRQLIRQMKILNFWITTFGILLLVALAVIGYLLFQVITFTRDAGQQLQQLKQGTAQKLDLKQQACSDQSPLGEYLRQQGGIC